MPVRENDIGYVYLVKLDKYYKIGKTKNKHARLGEFTKLPYELEPVCMMKVLNYGFVETELHEMFKEKRTRGEWFSLNDDDVNFIKQYLKNLIYDEKRVSNVELHNEESDEIYAPQTNSWLVYTIIKGEISHTLQHIFDDGVTYSYDEKIVSYNEFEKLCESGYAISLHRYLIIILCDKDTKICVSMNENAPAIPKNKLWLGYNPETDIIAAMDEYDNIVSILDNRNEKTNKKSVRKRARRIIECKNETGETCSFSVNDNNIRSNKPQGDTE